MKKLIFLFCCLYASTSNAQNLVYHEKIYNADSLFFEKQYLAAGKVYSSAIENNKSMYNQNDYINAATAYSLAKSADLAFRYLNYITKEKHYSNYVSLEKNTDLAFIKKDWRWRTLITNVKINYDRISKVYNLKLKSELEMIYDNDQKYRRLLDPAIKKYGVNSKQVSDLELKITEIDEINLKKISAIINKYGWLGPKTIGEKAAQALFIVAQHTDNDPKLQRKFLKMFEKAIAIGVSNNKEDYAMLVDRVSMYENKYQIYGSQLRLGKDNNFSPLPIKDSTNVDERRMKMGLKPLKYYIKLNNLYFNK